jgi:hypothetical protein
MCLEWKAWNSLLAAAPAVKKANAGTLLPASQKYGDYPMTYTYDLVDMGREVLAQLTIPVARNFSAAACFNSKGTVPKSAGEVRIHKLGRTHTVVL